ncbi:MAG: hypothetical protein MUC61_03470, partial [Amoebophilaceae bacterium]|nr:hypothetical protein [Amoebophilaceae bacterium]
MCSVTPEQRHGPQLLSRTLNPAPNYWTRFEKNGSLPEEQTGRDVNLRLDTFRLDKLIIICTVEFVLSEFLSWK